MPWSYNGRMTTTVLSVPEISCNHCKSAIESAVGAVSGVASVEVDIAAKTVTIAGDADESTVVAAIEDAGYDVAADA